MKKRKRLKRKRLAIFCVLLVVVVFILGNYLIGLISGLNVQLMELQGNSINGAESPGEYIPFAVNDDVLSYGDVNFSMYSQQALLINLTTGEVMFEHGADERVNPASLTKIMTVLVGIEQARSDTMIVRADFTGLMLANATMAGFEYGEERILMDVLHGAMLPSGADATSTIAYNVASSYEAFVELMNERARTLGMDNTNFTNASGLHNEFHYTSAYDMAILLRHALDNPTFREVFTAKDYSFTTLFGEKRVMKSTLFANMRTTEFVGGEIIGGRTGFTIPAGRCLASFATNGEDEFILITFGADQYEVNQTAHIFDAFTIYEYFLNMN